MTDLRKFPKVEHHRHLDGSLRVTTIAELARRNKIDLGVQSQAELQKKIVLTKPFETLEEVLNCFWTAQKVMCNYEAIKRIAFENVEDCYQDGVVLSELRFAPVFIMKDKPQLSFDEVFEGVIDGVHEAMKKFPIQVGLIHILPRGLDFEQCKLSTKECLRYAKSRHVGSDRLVGFDLADPESEDSFELFAPMVKEAKLAGLGITIHSGEDTSAAHMWKTLKVYAPHRIGHGIKSIDDPDLIKELIQSEIALEVCPTSNWLTGQVPSTKFHPFPKMLKSGLKLSLNSDDPHIMGIDLVREYEIASKEWGLEAKDFLRINREACQSSFLPEEIRTYILKKYL